MNPPPPKKLRRVRRSVVATVVLTTLVLASSLIPPLLDNPFQVARQGIVKAGEWSERDVFFLGGSYLFLGLVWRVQARAAITTSEGYRLAEIRMIHWPFAGWTVRNFEIGEATRDWAQLDSRRTEVELQ